MVRMVAVTMGSLKSDNLQIAAIDCGRPNAPTPRARGGTEEENRRLQRAGTNVDQTPVCRKAKSGLAGKENARPHRDRALQPSSGVGRIRSGRR